MSALAWLSLGANLGDPPAQLAEAVRQIADQPAIEITARSTVLATKPWGKLDQPDFANMALEIKTTLEPLDLLAALQAIELNMGRVREEVWGPRLIDIDIIAYDQRVMNTPRLSLPHPFAHERDFVLVPLREIAPQTADWIVRQAAVR